jgi:phosphopantothenoylcysteine decarboxylase / phosphopantothenate---cysteine ligase
MHPAESIRSEKSTLLGGKHVILGITGSIAAVQCFELTRELIRHGARVTVVMTREATRMLTPCAMEFASGRPVITEIGGGVEHVDLCGNTPDRADLLLIAPCSANTISKMATGIVDTPVTTMATMAIGTGMPVIVAPAMHGAMYDHPVLRRNIEALARLGLEMVGPRLVKDKAKMSHVDELVARVIRALGSRDLAGIRMLVVGGSSEEPIDRMRLITNRGTGETAIRLAEAAYMRGAEVEVWMGRHSFPLPTYIEMKSFSSVEDLMEMIDRVDHDLVMVPAALSDYGVQETEGKISSENGPLSLDLKPLPKALPALRQRAKVLVGFKAEHGVEREELERRAMRKMESVSLDAIVANDLRRVREGSTEVTVLLRNEEGVTVSGTKSEVAHALLDQILKVMR